MLQERGITKTAVRLAPTKPIAIASDSYHDRSA